MIDAAWWVLGIVVAATVGTVVFDESRYRIEARLAAFLAWVFAIPPEDDRPARHPRVRAKLLARLRPPRTPRRPD